MPARCNMFLQGLYFLYCMFLDINIFHIKTTSTTGKLKLNLSQNANSLAYYYVQI